MANQIVVQAATRQRVCFPLVGSYDYPHVLSTRKGCLETCWIGVVAHDGGDKEHRISG